MVLDSTAKLEFTVDSGTAVEFVAYAVNDSGTAISAVFNSGQSNGSTAVDIVPAPSASSFRVVKTVCIRNGDSVARVCTVRVDVSGTDREVRVVTLQAGETLEYDGASWNRYDANGRLYMTGISFRSAVDISPGFSTANLTTAKTITSGSTFALYMGKAPRTYSAGESVQIRLRVTTAMGTITWGEVAIATGPVSIGANPTLTVRGWTDVSATYNSLGQKSTSIAVATGQSILEGDDVWVLIGNAATTALQVRAASIADDLQTGMQASLATRPSLNVGNGQAYTIEGATTVPAWVALFW